MSFLHFPYKICTHFPNTPTVRSAFRASDAALQRNCLPLVCFILAVSRMICYNHYAVYMFFTEAFYGFVSNRRFRR